MGEVIDFREERVKREVPNQLILQKTEWDKNHGRDAVFVPLIEELQALMQYRQYALNCEKSNAEIATAASSLMKLSDGAIAKVGEVLCKYVDKMVPDLWGNGNTKKKSSNDLTPEGWVNAVANVSSFKVLPSAQFELLRVMCEDDSTGSAVKLLMNAGNGETDVNAVICALIDTSCSYQQLIAANKVRHKMICDAENGVGELTQDEYIGLQSLDYPITNFLDVTEYMFYWFFRNVICAKDHGASKPHHVAHMLNELRGMNSDSDRISQDINNLAKKYAKA